MSASTMLDLGRESFERRAWRAAHDALTAADREAPLGAEDLERLAVVCHLIGRDDDGSRAWARAHDARRRAGDMVGAARDAFWLAFGLLDRGEMGRGTGWLARAQRLLDDADLDCVERGYLVVPVAIGRLAEGDTDGAFAAFAEAAGTAERFGDPDLLVLARLGRGRALIRMGRAGEGVPLLDEVMVAVTAGEVAPLIVGDVYCSVIEACQEIMDMHRSQEWTAALTEWCASQPDLEPYRGQCLVHRAQILQLHGAWGDAMAEARRASVRLSHPPGQPAAGEAFYQIGELHRLRGEFAEAEEAFGLAVQAGRSPQPGFALLRWAQGQADAAAASLRRAIAEAHDVAGRARCLAAFVEVSLAAGDVDAARESAEELSEIAASVGAPCLRAMAGQASGAVLVGAGEPLAALRILRPACTTWLELGAPYDAARTRVLIGLGCRDLGDVEGENQELGAARREFRRLEATPDLARVDGILRPASRDAVGGLTGREVEVLRLVAAGMTNRAIADALFISEKTVARHISNIFAKLGLSTRAAATAQAYRHGLV